MLSEISQSQKDKYCMIPNHRFLIVINMILYKTGTFKNKINMQYIFKTFLIKYNMCQTYLKVYID